ncbi:argininosuccinate synthase [candidate division MSBL1 archaeon SCGC-AAA261O19]|uniref:Argininosuccinate synthase n=3 Tax=candidate division MSBL1 TaxID=215777 RepID=A0A133V227_9EURY|nr:argininosuccinate synthase [candidate division MSBL1 archaeon SCGC-AAA261C02]KXB04825.1 argininosuccinate synthase [candidate division MSBL1 archaeon SCGC-AAA261O19]KXB09327.1 argininosuccinate synthase [candidate division MSBL1 archaeon SCGC-AAA833K04]
MKVVLAFSGGLDTSVCLKLLQDKYEADVVTLAVNVGQDPEKLEEIKEKAEKLGAIKHKSFDLTKEFVENYVFKSIKANGLYEGYPLSTALARYPIAVRLVKEAHKEKADAVAHGCTGKGNDQFRFDTTISLQDPDLEIIAPVRELNLTRSWEIGYAKEQGIPIPVDIDQPYSIDENLWGRSIEGGNLEDPKNEPPEEIYELTQSPSEAPDPEVIEVEFEEGIPINLNGKKMDGVSLITKLNQIAGEHGVGRIDMIEDRALGLKSRENYEAPAATVILTAHKALEKLVLTRDELKFKESVDSLWADLVYRGSWFDPLREDLDAFIDNTQERVTGQVRVKLDHGSARVVSLESPFSLHEPELVSFEEFGFDQQESTGAIKFQSLQGRIFRKRQGE